MGNTPVVVHLSGGPEKPRVPLTCYLAHCPYSTAAYCTMATGSSGLSDFDPLDRGPAPQIALASSSEDITLSLPISNQNRNFNQVHGTGNTINNHNPTMSYVAYKTVPKESVSASRGSI